jgi:outer membrane protein assembly factor BamD (BamD/ComL family)
MQALTQALKSNNLDEAKAAFTKMSAQAPANAAKNPNSAMAQLGKALQAGNLGSAQQAFAAMRSHAPAAPGASAPASKPTATHGNFLDVMA